MKKKITSLFLVFILLVSLMPTVLAEDKTVDLLSSSTADVRVYIRAYDISHESTDGMVANANYMGEKYRAAFPGADVRVSTGGKTKTEVFAEMEALFDGSTDTTKNYVVLCGHGSSTGYHFILDKYTSIQLPKVVEELAQFKGKFFMLIAGCFVGQWINEEEHPEFIEKLDGYGSKFTLLTDASESNLYAPYLTGAAADITGKWADGLTLSYDESGYPHILADLNDDGVLTSYEQLCYCSSGKYNYDALIYPENDGSHFMEVPFRAHFFTGKNGAFSDGSDELTAVGNNASVTAPENPVPAEAGIVFDGWFTAPGGGEKVNFPITLEHHVNVYAQWSRNGEKLGFSDPVAGDTMRINYKDGTFGDYYILDTQHTNDGKDGMFLVLKTTVTTTTFASGLSSYAWSGSQAQQWCKTYYEVKVGDELDKLVSPSYASSIYSNEKLNGDKMFFLSRDEVEKYTTEEQNASLSRWWLRAGAGKFNLYYTGNEPGGYYSPTMGNSLGARPALNLSVGAADLIYEANGDYYTLKALKDVEPEEYEHIDLEYYVKVDGEIVYTATGERDKACDEMNTMAETPWSLSEPTAYNVFAGGKTTLVAGSYRGIPYSQYNRDFSSVDNLTDEFAENGLRGLDCSSATSYAIRKATDSDVLYLNNTAYRTRNFVGDALNTGNGSIMSVSHNGMVGYLDYVTIVGDYGAYRYGDEINTKNIISNILEYANYAEGTIYDHVYAKMKPGDILVRHYYKGTGTSDLSSHTQLVTGVELVYNDGVLDPDKSRVYFTDTSSPNRTMFRATGEKTSWANGNTVTKNYLTFTECTDSACLIPVTMNEWKEPADIISSGVDSKWMQNSGGDLEFGVNIPSNEITLVRIDGESVSYTTKDSTVVCVGNSVLGNLSEGWHNISVVSKNGEAVTNFKVIPCDHSMAVRQGDITATCTTPGRSGDLYCPNCDKIVEYSKDVPAMGHKPYYVGGVPATHTSEGRTGDVYCSVCKIFLAESEVIPKLVYYITPENATWQKGSGTSLRFIVNMTYKEFKNIKVDKTLCSYSYSVKDEFLYLYLSASIFEKLSVGKHTVTVTPKEGNAVICEVEIIKACEHEHTSLINVVDVTCTVDGYSGDIYCNDCQKVISEGLSVTATGHNFDVQPVFTWSGYDCTAKLVCICGETQPVACSVTSTVTKEATKDSDGLRVYTATAVVNEKPCTSTKTEIIPSLDAGDNDSSGDNWLIRLIKAIKKFFKKLSDTVKSWF